MGSQQWSHALLDCGGRDPKNIFPRAGDLFMGSHCACLWDPRTGHMLRLTLADGIPRTLLLGPVINVWDPRAFFVGSQAKSHAYSLPWLTKSQKQFYYVEWFIHGISNCIYKISCYIACIH